VTTTLASNLRQVRADLQEATSDAGRSPECVELIAVVKQVTAQAALDLAALGCLRLAENRLAGLLEKRARFAAEGVQVEWHFIGHIQRNKARRIVQNAAVLHSVDSERLLLSLDRIAAEEQLQPRIFLEVKLADETEKHGLAPDQLESAVRLAGSLAHLDLTGLMCMAPRLRPGADDQHAAQDCFRQLAQLAAGLARKAELKQAFSDGAVKLSMGMSGDFGTAVAEGSHLCRVGSALFRGLDQLKVPRP
jgi:hypothetical protein